MPYKEIKAIKLLLAMACLIGASIAIPGKATPLAYSPGYLYSTDEGDTNIMEYSGSGELLNTLQLVGLNRQEETKGLVFGPDGRMYIVLDTLYTSARLVAIDPNGAIVSSYALPNATGGNLSYGKVMFVDDYHVLVGTGDGLIRVDIRNETSAQTIYNGSVFDLEQLPNGNLIVIDENKVWELTADGAPIREIVLTDSQHLNQTPYFLYSNLRGLEYNPWTNQLYLSMGILGGAFDGPVMIFDYALQDLIGFRNFMGVNDIFLLDSKTLLIGDRYSAPLIVSPSDLSEIGKSEGEERMFVTGIRTASAVPVTTTSSLLGLAIVGLWASRSTKNSPREVNLSAA